MCKSQDMPTAPAPAARLLPCARRAMSLIEIMIAIGILGLGLTMVATIFPLALNQHRISTDHILSADVARQAQTIMRNRSVNLPGNGNVYVYPYEVEVGDRDFADDYIELLNDNVNLGWRIAWDDVLYPPQGAEALDRRQRYTWISFARSDQGITQYTVFVCRRTGGQRFALQDETDWPDLEIAGDVLLPTPWKLPVTLKDIGLAPTKRWIFRLQGDRPNLSLEDLVRPGSKLLSQATGHIYTVLKVNDGDDTPTKRDDSLIFVLEDPRGEGPDLTELNVWIVPGAVDMRRSFGKSPVVDVLCFAGPG